MNRMLPILPFLALALGAQTLTPTKPAHNMKLRRSFAAAQCAAGAFDTLTTFHAASIDPYGTESNPMLRDSHLRPSPWRFALVKGALCAGAWILAENRRVSDSVVVAYSAIWTVPDVIYGARNLGIQDTRPSKTAARIQPGTPR